MVVVTCLHGRAQITRIWLEHTLSLDLPVFAALTKGDEENLTLLREQYRGVRFTETDNQPLGRKHNAALSLAMGYGNRGAPSWTAAMLLPSDDLVSPEWVDLTKELSKLHDYILPTSCAMYDTAGGRAMLLEQNGDKIPKFGAGRVVTRAAIERAGSLWYDGRPRGLDSNSHQRLMSVGIRPYYAGTGMVPVVDLKGPDNLWPYNERLGEPIPIEDALHMASEVHRAFLSTM